MSETKTLEEQLDFLNERQRAAVDAVDGPLLVVAGPGTGKTQLLSLRAANILDKRDVQPENILCLTFTEAGAEAMRKRLVELIGRPAYGIEVCTFHGFASGLRKHYPERFGNGAPTSLISPLHQAEIVNDALKAIHVGDPLYSYTDDKGVNGNYSSVASFIGTFKMAGIEPAQFRAIQQQTLDYLDYLERETEVLAMVNGGLPRKKDEKFAFCEAFEAAVVRAAELAPKELTCPVVSTPGIYVPYALYLRNLVESTELIDESGKTGGFQEMRKAVFEKDDSGYIFKDRQICLRSLSALGVFEHYEAKLAEEGLYDFNDMIADAIKAMSSDPVFLAQLQERYRYIQVDEFQDTNGSQMRIVELLCEGIERPNVMVVGDDDQAIMRFQGASVECIKQFAARFDPKSIVLKTNYRSTPAVVDMGQEIAKQIDTRLDASSGDKDIQAFRADSEQVEFADHVFESADLQYYAVAKDIRERIDAGFISSCKDPSEAIAVIAPKHKSLKALIPYLRHFNIPFAYRETSEVSGMECMQTLLAAIRFVVLLSQGREERAGAWLPQIVASKEMGVGQVECVNFALYAKREHHRDWIAALRATDHARLAALRELLFECAGEAPAAPVRELVFKLAQPCLRYYKQHEDENMLELAEFNAGVRALVEFAQAELAAAAVTGRTMRLADVLEHFDLARAYRQSIDATISVGKADAIRLTSAHSSKGLEFDLVYLIDSDDGSWRRDYVGTALFSANMLLGSEKNDDDVRRLLFVAITRAKRLLETYRAGTTPVRELQGLTIEQECAVDASVLDCVIETDWHASYALDTPELVALLAPDLARLKLSASALNDFVEYAEGCTNSVEFPSKRVMRLPQEPALALEFGTTVHAFFENYVNHVLRSPNTTLEELAARYRQEILWLDFAQAEVETYADRFDRIVATFVPWLTAELSSGARLVTEAAIDAVLDGEIALFGFCDLLVVDDDARTVRIIDYKTGFNTEKASTGYTRQLQFYRLLIESSHEFAGYHVVDSADVFVEPDKNTGALREPVVTVVSDDELAHLYDLICAVWRRIQVGEFDTSAFEQSPQMARYIAGNVNKDGSPSKRVDRKALQAAYEDWLIEQG